MLGIRSSIVCARKFPLLLPKGSSTDVGTGGLPVHTTIRLWPSRLTKADRWLVRGHPSANHDLVIHACGLNGNIAMSKIVWPRWFLVFADLRTW